MAPSFQSERPVSEPPTCSKVQAEVPKAQVHASEEYVADHRCSDSIVEMASCIASMKTPVCARAVAGCLIHSAAVDAGFQLTSGIHPSFMPSHLQASGGGGLWRQSYFNEALSSTSSFTASVFQMAGSQLIYLHVPGSAYGLRQQVVSNDMLQLPSVSEMSQTTVMECLQPVYLNIKSKMMVWAANVLLLCASKQQQCGILALPTEALTNTLSRLSYADVAVLASVSRRMKSVASERSVWECLLKQEFSQEAPADKDPQQVFKQAVADRKRRREAMQASMQRPGGYRRDPHFAPAPRLPPQLPGVVGGEYDRLPPGMAAGTAPYHPLASRSAMAPGPGLGQYPNPGLNAGRMGRSARREAGIGNALGGSSFGIGDRGSGGGFGGFGHGPFGSRGF